MTVFDIADATTPFFDACMFFLLFEAFLVRRPIKRSPCFLLGIPILTLGIAVSNHFLMYQLGNALVMIAAAVTSIITTTITNMSIAKGQSGIW